jgi:dienelactone hydrolase
MSEKLQARVVQHLLEQIQAVKAENVALAVEAGQMHSPCCVGIVRKADGLTGNESRIGDLKMYQNFTKGAKVGVVVIHDIFGFNLPNCKYIVDHLARNGLSAVLPGTILSIVSINSNKLHHPSLTRYIDFYRGDAWPATETEVTEELDGAGRFGGWFGSKTTPQFWSLFQRDVENAVDALRSVGCRKFCVIGFCWGGKAAM